MTITYDPKHPKYLDEADVRDELTRVYDVCHGCRLCFKFCTAFPSLFDMIDQFDDHDAGRLTPAQQDRVIDECFQCKLCYVNCPYVPGQSELEVDFPRLMLRADAMRHSTGQKKISQRATTSVMGRTDLLGTIATKVAPIANKSLGASGGSFVRKAMSKVTGVSSVRLLPPYARQRFSTWFKKRPKLRSDKPQGKVTVFPTCLVEYQAPAVGRDLVKVYERNGIECDPVRCRLLRCTVAALGRHRAVHQGRQEERRHARRGGAEGDGDRRTPTHVRLRVEEGLRRLRRRDRRRARGEAHVRRRRVPDQGPPRRRNVTRHQVHRRCARHDHVSHALPSPRPERRA